MSPKFVLLALVVGFVSAQTAPDVPLTQEAAAAKVLQEQALSSAYLDAMLKLQHATYSSNAASSFIQAGSKQENSAPEQSRLIASYNLLQATIIKSYQIIFGAAQVQQEFQLDRLQQLSLQAAGQQASPQALQLLYFKSYTTLLKTLKFSYALQVVSHFRTWLEDEIDVGTAVVGRVNNFQAVALDQQDDLIQDKLFAFNSYHSSALLDLQLTYLDFYVQQATQGPAVPVVPVANATSFLEEEEAAQPSEFFPTMLAQNPAALFSFYKLWRVMYEYNAARFGLAAVQAEQQAYAILNDNDPSNDADAFKSQETAQQLWTTGFAQNLYLSSQIEYITSLYALYAIYAPALGATGGFFF